jgi:hypothetical protein
MPDTQQTIADLLTIFADGQQDGSITAQDVRDLITTLRPSFGSMFVSTPAVTNIMTTGVYVKAAGTTGLAPGITARNFTQPGNNQLTYGGTVKIHGHATVAIAVSSAIGGKEIGVKVAQNDIVINESEVTRVLGGAGEAAAVFVQAEVELDPTDFVNLHVANLTDNTDITVDAMNFHIVGMTI